MVLRRRKESRGRRTRREEGFPDDGGSGSWERTGEPRRPGGRGDPPPPAGVAPRGRRSRPLGLDAGDCGMVLTGLAVWDRLLLQLRTIFSLFHSRLISHLRPEE